jgi:HKD family nuclease
LRIGQVWKPRKLRQTNKRLSMTFDLVPRVAQTLTRVLPKATKFYGAVALMNDYGLSLIKQLSSGCKTKLVLGIDLPTPHKVFQELSDMPTVKFTVHQTNKAFHPKVYLLEVEKKWHAFVGSANFTQGGFETNIEMTRIDNGASQQWVRCGVDTLQGP